MQSHITIFTDGASSGNPGPGGWGAIVSYNDHVTELGGGEPKTTNNRMELQAVVEALSFVVEQHLNTDPVTLYTDSSYVANGITSWLKGWQQRNWTNQAGQVIANVDIWQKMAQIVPDISLKIINVSGHSGVQGNEQADKIATGFAKNMHVRLYHGPENEYEVDLKNLSMNTVVKKEKDRKSAKAYSYLSLVNGELKIHYTWNECKARVEGVKGAKYKKAISKEDEDVIKRSWGIKNF